MKNQPSYGFAVWLLIHLVWSAPVMSVEFDEGLIVYYPFEGRDDIIRDAGGSEIDGNIQTAVREQRENSGGDCAFPIRTPKPVSQRTPL